MTTTNPRCVVDTNVLISAFISDKGNPRKTVRHVLGSGVLLASTATFEEFDSRIRRPRISKHGSPDELEAYVGLLSGQAEFITVTESITACSDPDDNMFLELAVSGAADYIVTGNMKDFPPSPFQGIPILSPAEFVEMVMTEK